MTDAQIHTLPAKLDLSTAADLASALNAARGSDLHLDAGPVTHLGTPGLQVILSARRTWSEDGFSLKCINFEAALVDQLVPLGLTQADLETDSAAQAAQTQSVAESDEE